MKEGQSCTVYEIQGDAISSSDVSFDVKRSVGVICCSDDGSKVAVSDAKTINVYQLCDGFKVSQITYRFKLLFESYCTTQKKLNHEKEWKIASN